MNRELAKFAIYIAFPIGSLYIYNRPELHNSFIFQDQNKAVDEFRTKNPAKMPRDYDELQLVIKEYDKQFAKKQ